jgi:hypothetical protein
MLACRLKRAALELDFQARGQIPLFKKRGCSDPARRAGGIPAFRPVRTGVLIALSSFSEIIFSKRLQRYNFLQKRKSPLPFF